MVSFLVCFAAAENICKLNENIFCHFCFSVTPDLHLHLIKSLAASVSIRPIPVRSTYF